MTFANDADKPCNRVKVGLRFTLIVQSRRGALSRLASRAQPLEHTQTPVTAGGTD